MTDKKYYFLSGVPRSGNTILSCILNQNKNIGVTANSLLPEVFYNLQELKKENKAYANYPDNNSYDSLLRGIIPSYYTNWEQKYIIDRSSWGTPYNYDILKKYCPNEIKIISLVRNTEDVFSSFIDWCEKNPRNYINEATNNGSLIDKFNYLFHPNNQIIKSLASIKNLILNHPNNHIIIDYDDLIKNPKKEIDKIYNFLNIPLFEHNFNYIKQTLKYDDSLVGKNLHKIRVNGVKKRIYKTNIPKYIIDKCEDFNFWKKYMTL